MEKGLSLQVLTVVSQAAGLWERFCLGTGCEGKRPYQWTDMGLNSMKEQKHLDRNRGCVSESGLKNENSEVARK